MKTSILALAIALAFSFTATPADAAPSEQDRCKRQVAKAERKHAGCVTGVAARSLRFGQQTGPQPAALSTCDTRRATALDRIGAKFPSLAPGDCGLDTASAAARAAAALVLAGLEEPIDNAAIAAAAAQAACEDANGTWENDACAAVDITSDNASLCSDAGGTYDAGTDTCSVDITSDNEAVCTDAGGMWDGSVCTPATVADRDCFREGVCGADGWRARDYASVTISSTGCSETVSGTDSYNRGDEWASYHWSMAMLSMCYNTPGSPRPGDR